MNQFFDYCRHPEVFGAAYAPFHQTRSNTTEQINECMSDPTYHLRFYELSQDSKDTNTQSITADELDSNQTMNKSSPHNISIEIPIRNLEEGGISNSNEMHTNQEVQLYQLYFDDNSSINSGRAVEVSEISRQNDAPNHYTDDESCIYIKNGIPTEIQIDSRNDSYVPQLNLHINSIPLYLQEEEIHLTFLEAPNNESEQSNKLESDEYDSSEENPE